MGGITGPQPGLIAPWNAPNNFTAGGVLAGIGEELLNGNAQPLDILALQETTSNPLTVSPIANGLNTFYGMPGMFTNSTLQATSSNPSGTGNGPNALVYNTRTVQLLAAVGLTPPNGTFYGSSSGMYRQVVRYQFAPAGVATNAGNIFYVYVSHYKSGVGSANEIARQGEAQIIRNNSATLSPNSRILYVGDFNTGVAAEGMYVTLIAPGTNQGLDPINPAGYTNLTWDDGTSALDVKTYAPTWLHYRDDYQMMTTNVYSGLAGGLKFIPGTYHVFGNNGSVAYLGNLTTNVNTALNGKLITNGPVFIGARMLYTNLTYAADHLPVVADYTIPMPAPVITGFSLAGANLTMTVTNGITNAVYAVLMQTNVAAPLTNWLSPASYTATSGVFTFTATNVVDGTASSRFYRLRGK